MATTTPLGFIKPDGNDPARDGDNVIATNAQKVQDYLGNALPRLRAVELAAFTAGSLPLIEDPDDPGFFSVAAGSSVTEDPDYPGFYLTGG